MKIFSPKEVELADGKPPAKTMTPETYAKYPLIISSQDVKKEIAHVTSDENGQYRVALPPSAYILDVKDRVAKRVRAKPQPFTVVSNQTVRVDMSIFTGLAKLSPEQQFQGRTRVP